MDLEMQAYSVNLFLFGILSSKIPINEKEQLIDILTDEIDSV